MHYKVYRLTKYPTVVDVVRSFEKDFYDFSQAEAYYKEQHFLLTDFEGLTPVAVSSRMCSYMYGGDLHTILVFETMAI